MNKYALLLALTPSLFACAKPSIEIADGFMYGCSPADASTMPIDMAVAPPRCAAAKGLAGDNLLCVDFKDVQMLASLGGWAFSCVSGTSWSTANKVLEVNNFATFMSSCTFQMPALSAADYAKYSSFTLSVVQTVDLNPAQQNAYVYLGAELPTQRMWTVTGKYAKANTAIQIAKADLPNGGSGVYLPLFKVTSGVSGGGYMGWQIESIAINGVQ